MGAMQTPYRAPIRDSIDLVLEARGVIEQIASEEIADEIKLHRERQAVIDRRHVEDTLEEAARHRTYLERIESTRRRITQLERQMAAQLSIVGYPTSVTPELVALAQGVTP